MPLLTRFEKISQTLLRISTKSPRSVAAAPAHHQTYSAHTTLLIQGPVSDHIFNTLLSLYHSLNPSFRSSALQCLGKLHDASVPAQFLEQPGRLSFPVCPSHPGFLFRAYPSLMTRESMTKVMDDILKSSEAGDKLLLLKIIQEFLMTEHARRGPETAGQSPKKQSPTKVDMSELVGNTEGFADSG